MAEWCAEQPERRAGIGQLLLNDVDEAVRDVHWIADHGLRGGVLLPGIPPGSTLIFDVELLDIKAAATAAPPPAAR